MPTYLCHGFRWHRPSIRVYVIVQDIGDAAPDCIIGTTNSATAILESFYDLFDFLPLPSPQRQQHQTRYNEHTPPQQEQPATDSVANQAWSAVRLLEEYDPGRLGEASRPHAYVADYAVRVDLSASVADEMSRYEERLGETGAMGGPHSDETGRRQRGAGDRKAGWLEKLRDQLQRGEEIRWYVVVNGDEERSWKEGQEDDDDDDGSGSGVSDGMGRRPSVCGGDESSKREEGGIVLHGQTARSAADEHRERERYKLRQSLGGLCLDDEESGYGHGCDSGDLESSSRSRGSLGKGPQPLTMTMAADGDLEPIETKMGSRVLGRLFSKGRKVTGNPQ